MVAASIVPCSRGNDVALLLCCTNSPNPCGRCPSLDEVGERGIAGSILSDDISDLSILVAAVAAVVALAEPSYSKGVPEMRCLARQVLEAWVGERGGREAGRQRGEVAARPEGLDDDGLLSGSLLSLS